jgi:hypothetical protein
VSFVNADGDERTTHHVAVSHHSKEVVDDGVARSLRTRSVELPVLHPLAKEVNNDESPSRPSSSKLVADENSVVRVELSNSLDDVAEVLEVGRRFGSDWDAEEAESVPSDVVSDSVHHLPHRLDRSLVRDVLPRRKDFAILVLGRDENSTFEGADFGEDVGLEAGFEKLETSGGDAGVDLGVAEGDGLRSEDVGSRVGVNEGFFSNRHNDDCSGGLDVLLDVLEYSSDPFLRRLRETVKKRTWDATEVDGTVDDL